MLNIHFYKVISSHLLKQEAIFPAVRFLLDVFNKYFILFTCVPNFSVGGVSPWTLIPRAGLFCSSFGWKLLLGVPVPSSWSPPASPQNRLTSESYFGYLSSWILCYLECILSLKVQSQFYWSQKFL